MLGYFLGIHHQCIGDPNEALTLQMTTGNAHSSFYMAQQPIVNALHSSHCQFLCFALLFYSFSDPPPPKHFGWYTILPSQLDSSNSSSGKYMVLQNRKVFWYLASMNSAYMNGTAYEEHQCIWLHLCRAE